MEYLQNPLIVAGLAGALTYGYMYYENKKKYDKNPKVKPKPINYIIPIIVSVFAYFIASSFVTPVSVQHEYQPTARQTQILQQLSEAKPCVLTQSDNSLGSASYRLLNKHSITLPETDVFIGIAKF